MAEVERAKQRLRTKQGLELEREKMRRAIMLRELKKKLRRKGLRKFELKLDVALFPCELARFCGAPGGVGG